MVPKHRRGLGRDPCTGDLTHEERLAPLQENISVVKRGVTIGQTRKYWEGRTAAILMSFTLTNKLSPTSTFPSWGRVTRS